jgi:hypothetical protein
VWVNVLACGLSSEGKCGVSFQRWGVNWESQNMFFLHLLAIVSHDPQCNIVPLAYYELGTMQRILKSDCS